MKIAIASCENLPGWEKDDRPFHQALREKGAEVNILPWTDSEIDWSAFDAVLIRTTWDYWDVRDAFVEWAKKVEQGTLLFNPSSVVSWNTDKRYLLELEGCGFPLAPSRFITQWSEEDEAWITNFPWQRGFIKPVVGANASDTLRFDATDWKQARAHIQSVLPKSGVIIQPYLETVETEGEVSLIYFDGAFSHGVRKIPVPGDFRVQDDHGASDHPFLPSEEERKAGQETIRAAERSCGLRNPLLYARVDLLRSEGEWVLNELELVEPSLFFRHCSEGASSFAEALLKRVSTAREESR